MAELTKSIDQMQEEWDEEIRKAGALTEKELREAKVPYIKTMEELNGYIDQLVQRPHDYGTCVYAMSMAAVAAFNYVAGQLGVSGFQASCAEMDILRRTRSLEMGFSIIDWSNVLYPQYVYAEDARGVFYQGLLREPQNQKFFADEARKKLAKEEEDKKSEHYYPPSREVLTHWEYLTSLWPEGKELPEEEREGSEE